LSASDKSGHDVLLGELIEVSLEPFTHRVVVNRGSDTGVYVGQPVIDSEGIMGQVTGVSPSTSAITLVTDAGHAIPVQVRRNGLRAIVYGVGQANRLSVPYLPPQADIRRGDMLVTSGLGGRFPVGHPVAEVSHVLADANEPFLAIDAEPAAHLEYAKNVLLVWPDSKREKSIEPDDTRRRIAEPTGTNIADEADANGA
jgi:rod shape-determining protein MreC